MGRGGPTLLEALEVRSLLNAAPTIGNNVEVSISLARMTPNGETVVWSYDELLTKSQAQDADGDPLVFYVSFFDELIAVIPLGTLTNGGQPLTATQPVSSLPPGSPYFVEPGDALVFTPNMYKRSSMPILVRAYDGQALSKQFYLSTHRDLGTPGPGGVNGGSGGSGGSGGNGGSGGSGGGGGGGEVGPEPVENQPVVLGITAQNRGFSLTYSDALALAGVSNAAMAESVVSIPGIRNGSLRIDGAPAGVGAVLTPGSSLRWETTENQILLDAFTLRLTPKTGAPIDTTFRARQPSTWEPGAGPWAMPEGGAASVLRMDTGVELRAWRSTLGEAIVETRGAPLPDGTPSGLRRTDLLEAFDILTVSTDPLLLRSPIDGGVRLVLPMETGGVRLFRVVVSADLSVRLTEESLPATTGPSAPISMVFRQLLALPLAGEIDRVIFAARSDADVIVFQGLRGSEARTAWTARSMNTDLFNNTQTLPAFAGSIAGYRTPWGGWNLAGLDGGGKLRSVWTASADGAPNSSDLTRISNGPRFTGAVGAMVTPWNGINLTAQNAAGELIVTWWVPQFGGRWEISNFSSLFGGSALRPGSVTAYATSWNALNIVGIDAEGRVRVYWWEPTRAADPRTDTWSLDTLAPGGLDAGGRLSASFDAATGAISIVGRSASGGEPLALSWRPGDEGRWSFDRA